jgi:spore maturation protein CgeB
LEPNRRAIGDTGGKIAALWLLSDDFEPVTELREAFDGSDILIVGGRHQDSQRAPAKDAENLISHKVPPAFGGTLCLFGLGSPVLTSLLLKKYKVMAFEPEVSVARRFFSLYDLNSHIREGRFSFVCPWDLREGLEKPASPFILTHPASQRRAPALCQRFKLSILEEIRKKPENLKLLIIPPFSGGSLSMGPFLRKAAEKIGLKVKLFGFSPELNTLAQKLKESGALGGPGFPGPPREELGKAAASVFGKAKEEIIKEMGEDSPHLVLALAQAPLDLSSLIEIKDRFPESLLSYWFVEDYRRFGYINEIAPACDLFFHIQGPLLDPFLKNMGLKRAYYLPTAADADFFRPRNSPHKYRARVSFAGAGYPNRLKIFNDLLEGRFRTILPVRSEFKIFGSGWEKAFGELKKHLFEAGRRVSAEEMAYIYAGTEVNLNIHSSSYFGFEPDSYFVNPRTFEIAAAGGFQIVDARPLLGELFGDREIAVIESPEELPNALETALNDGALREKMGKLARERVKREHLYTHRLETILSLAYPED